MNKKKTNELSLTAWKSRFTFNLDLERRKIIAKKVIASEKLSAEELDLINGSEKLNGSERRLLWAGPNSSVCDY